MPTENATDRIVRITQQEQTRIPRNTGTERLPINRIGAIMLAVKRRFHTLEVRVCRCRENRWVDGGLHKYRTLRGIRARSKRMTGDVQARHHTRDENHIVDGDLP